MKTVVRMFLVVGGFVLVCALAAAVRLHRVHDQTGEWRLHPDAAPAILRIHGHLYDRTRRASAHLPGLKASGQVDLGGGRLLLPSDSSEPVTQFQVRFGGRLYDYRLAG